MTDVQPHELYDFFVANRDRLADWKWLAGELRPQCRNLRRGWDGDILQAVQEPTELAPFLVQLSKLEIQSYLEIGLFRGGLFFIVDSYLRACVPGFERSVGYDRENNVAGWREYKRRWPSTGLRIKPSEQMTLGDECFHLSMVDGDHSRSAVGRDFEKVRHNSRFVAFHDIAARKDNVGDLWRSLQADFPIRWEFVRWLKRRKCRMGIGLIKLHK
jgi:hypothetical protein